MLRLDHVRSEEDGPANDVPELPHVPWPGVAQKELRLRGEGKVDDLIEEEASALCQLELPLLALMRSRERALLIAEELRLDQGVRDRAAVDSDERFIASGTQLMDRASDELLASAG